MKSAGKQNLFQAAMLSLVMVIPATGSELQANQTGSPSLLLTQQKTSITPEKARMQAWQKFWTVFKSATRSEDKGKLYQLTVHSKFRWDEGRLDLPSSQEENAYEIPTIKDFKRVYSNIFSPNMKSKILNLQPTDTKVAGFTIEWHEKGQPYYFVYFSEVKGQFLFSGIGLGPTELPKDND